MFWFNKTDSRAMFVDKRRESHVLCDGRALEISPDLVADFTTLPFPAECFYLVVFDPPHMTSLGENSWLAKNTAGCSETGDMILQKVSRNASAY
jgi:hypothetical protein